MNNQRAHRNILKCSRFSVGVVTSKEHTRTDDVFSISCPFESERVTRGIHLHEVVSQLIFLNTQHINDM
jgi:hypothetical protein